MSKIFISYRREDSNATCGRIYDRLVARFGKEAVFKDVDSIPLGVPFPDYIAGVIQQCAIQLVVIGPHFSDVTDTTGRPRLENPEDFVRVEVEAGLERALRRETVVVPVLVQGATMPDRRALPESLRLLVSINGLPVRYDPDFAGDMHRLITQIEGWLGVAAPAASVTSVTPARHDAPQPAPVDPRLVRARRLAAEARAAYEARDFTDAYLKAEDALGVPAAASAELRALLAFAYAGAGQWQRARDAAKQALGEDADNVVLWRTLATAQRQLHAPNDALAALDGARRAVPFTDSVTRLAILAERRAIETEQRQWPAAISTLEDELRLAPDDAARLEALADLQEKAGRPQEALETLRRLTARPDARAAAWIARARLAISLKDAAEARTAFAPAARLAPNDAAIATLRADLLALLAAERAQLTAQSRWDDALAVLDQQLNLAPGDADLLAERARLLLRAGRADDALAVARQLSERPNATVEDWLSRARALIALQRGGEAWQALVEAQRRFPQAAETAPTRAALLALVRPLSERPDATADHWLARARLAQGEGESDEAWQALLRATRLAPRDAAVPRARAELFPPAALPPRLAQLGFAGANRAGVQFIVPPLCAIPAGAFVMGSDPRRDNQARSDEQPQQRVTLAAYQIARFPVTVAEYACFSRARHAAPQAGGWGDEGRNTQLQELEHPITNVTWHDAVAYAAWLAEVTGQPWRLPSEAEWEKAARGTDGRIYPWGNTFESGRANTSESGKRTTTPVGAYPSGASPCGAGDMAGNVWEWTASIYIPYPYSYNDGREDLKSTENRVLRGGSWLRLHGRARGLPLPRPTRQPQRRRRVPRGPRGPWLTTRSLNTVFCILSGIRVARFWLQVGAQTSGVVGRTAAAGRPGAGSPLPAAIPPIAVAARPPPPSSVR